MISIGNSNWSPMVVDCRLDGPKYINLSVDETKSAALRHSEM